MNKNLKIALVVGTLALVVASVLGLALGAFDFSDDVSAVYGEQPKANLGNVVINAGRQVPIYTGPGSMQTAGVLLPNDADNGGFDTYVVQECEYVGSDLWIGVWVGSSKSAWMPYSIVDGVEPGFEFNPALCD